jgi:methyltransferase (TIGR00027 family)
MVDKITDKCAIGSTAYWTAAARAAETERTDRLFEDPWAVALAGSEGAAWVATRSSDSLTPMVLRIRYFDDFLQRVATESPLRQVVLLAAGLDTRAFRLTWPAGTVIFELDQPGILLQKDQVLLSLGAHPTCTRHIIEVDLTSPWEKPLLGAGFDPTLPSLWLMEGFFFYIQENFIAQILDKVNDLSASGSALGFDIINRETLTSPYTRQWIEMQAASGAPWIGAMDDPAGFLSSRGWQAKLSQAGAPDANHDRWRLPILPVNLPGMPHNWFVTAKKS